MISLFCPFSVKTVQNSENSSELPDVSKERKQCNSSEKSSVVSNHFVIRVVCDKKCLGPSIMTANYIYIQSGPHLYRLQGKNHVIYLDLKRIYTSINNSYKITGLKSTYDFDLRERFSLSRFKTS
jgi:predicted DNA binding protein